MLVKERIEKETFATFDSDTLRSKITEGPLGKLVNNNYLGTIAETVTQTMSKDKTKTRAQFIDQLRKDIKARGVPFTFSEELLSQVYDIASDTSYSIRLVELRDGNNETLDLYENDFLQDIPEKIKPVFRRAIPSRLRSTAFILSQEGDDRKSLTSPAFDFDTFIWIPIVPTDITFDKSKTKVDYYKVIDRFEKIMEGYYNFAVADKGMVRVTGPGGAEFLCGEVIGSKERSQIKDKVIELDNGYKINIFI